MQLKIFLVFLLLLFASFCDSKRSRGRSRGSSGGSTFWNRKSKSSAEPKPPVTQPKPVQTKPAPKEPEIKKQTTNVQQSAPPQESRPIGWDVNNNNQKQNINPSYSASNPHAVYPNSGAYPQNTGGYGHGQPSGGYNNYGGSQGHNYGQPPPPYPGSPHNMGGNSYGQAPPPYPGSPHNMGGNSYGQAPPPYPGMPQNNMGGHGYGSSGGYNYGQPPPPYPGMPQNNMGGYGHGGGYSQQQTGLMGSMFGGKKQGYGGYGGYGGVGGYGGYGMKKSGGFFGKHAFRNVLGGLFVFYLVSGLMSTPYRVYNIHNQPKEFREEIQLPANVLTLCNENATNICVPGTIAICTQDNRILCVTSMSAVSPCQENNGGLCVNSTIPCEDANDPLCQNKTAPDNTTTVNLPCFTNVTLQTEQMALPSNITLPTSENNTFCVTTMAVPDPSITSDEGKPPELQAVQTELTPLNNTTQEFNATLPVNR